MHQVKLDVSEELAEELKHHQSELQSILKLGLHQLKKDRRKKDESDNFLNSPLGQYVLSFVNSNVTLEQVQEELSGIKGSLAADVIAEREE